MQGQYAEVKRLIKERDLEASGLLTQLRMILNPYEDDLTKLELEKAKVTLQRLIQCVTDLNKLKEKKKRLELELFGETSG